MPDYLHSACLRVFAKEEDDIDAVQDALVSFFPFNLEGEKIELKRHTALGFKDKKIRIMEVCLKKKRHLKLFLSSLLEKLSAGQKELLLRQKESRLDDELDFFIRFEKPKLVGKNAEEREFFITDSGDCFHLTLSIAAFPAKRETALAVIDEIFK